MRIAAVIGLCLLVTDGLAQPRGGLTARTQAGGATGSTFSELLNPTGDPIGGGPGYSNIITGCVLTVNCHEVTGATNTDRVNSLKSFMVGGGSQAASGDTIFVPGTMTIDLTSEVDQGTLVIPAGVIFASNRGEYLGGGVDDPANYSRGARLHITDRGPAGDGELFGDGGDNVRFTGVRLEGTAGYIINGRDQATGDQVWGFQHQGHGIEVDNIECYGFIAICVRGEKPAAGAETKVHHNHMHNNLSAGFGYSHWFNSYTTNNVYANLAYNDRHSLASSSNTHLDWAGYYNIAPWGSHQPYFDRHSPGGGDTDIHHNWVQAGANYTNAGGDPAVGDTARFRDNWLENEVTDHFTCSGCTRTLTTGNHLNNANQNPPTAVITGPALVNNAVSITLDGSTSSDPDGHTMWPSRYIWWPMDDSRPGWDPPRGVSLTQSWSVAGRYDVHLFVQNSFGVQSRTVDSRHQLFVLPPAPTATTDKYVLTTAVNGSEDRSGHHTFSILVGGTTVYTTDMSNLYVGFTYIEADITANVAANTAYDVEFRITADQNQATQPSADYRIIIYVDKVHVFGGNISTAFLPSDPVTSEPSGGGTTGTGSAPGTQAFIGCCGTPGSNRFRFGWRNEAGTVDAGDTAFINWVTSRQLDTAPEPPLTSGSAWAGATPGAGSGECNLTSDAMDGATSYAYYRSTTSGYGWVEVPGLTSTSEVDTGLTGGQTYYYRATAKNANSESLWSVEDSCVATS